MICEAVAPKAALEVSVPATVPLALKVTTVPLLMLVIIEYCGTLLVTAVFIGMPTASPAVLAIVT